MLFDTDIFIWVQRGNLKAANIIDANPIRYISVQTYMELLQCAKNKQQHRYIKDFINKFNFVVLPFTQNIGNRAAIYIEEYSLTHGLRTGDSIIAATTVEHNLSLISSNSKHFKPINELDLIVFIP